MRLKVNQNLNWVIWGNDSTESSGANTACKIKSTELVLSLAAATSGAGRRGMVCPSSAV